MSDREREYQSNGEAHIMSSGDDGVDIPALIATNKIVT
jgi:hypothetical protein